VQPLGRFPAFYGTRRLITEFTRALHLYLSWAKRIQSTTLTPISKRSILMLYIYLRLSLPSGLFPSGFPTNNLYTFLFSPFSVCLSVTGIFLTVRGCWPHAQPPSWRTAPCLLSAAAYSIYSQLTSSAGGRLFNPQPEDAPCCADKGTHITWIKNIYMR
jgi:hypothetical protein